MISAQDPYDNKYTLCAGRSFPLNKALPLASRMKRIQHIELPVDLFDSIEELKKQLISCAWAANPVDLGYLAIYAAQNSLAGTLKDSFSNQTTSISRQLTRIGVKVLSTKAVAIMGM